MTMGLTKQPSEKVLYDFSANADPTEWQVVNDDVMGGESSSRFVITNGAAVFSGDISLANSGGFASVRTLPRPPEAGAYRRAVVRVRGDGRRYKFTARMGRQFEGVVYQAAFGTKQGEWQETRLEFDDLVPTFRGQTLANVARLDPGALSSVGFLISDKQAGPFRLEIAWIKVAR
jgi:NADH dehydrogenase [ubiquinone] 1 alpha subcomplex assembly factor 1